MPLLCAPSMQAWVRFAALKPLLARRREEGDGHDSAGPQGAAAQRTDTDGKDSGRHAHSASAWPAARNASHGAKRCHGQAACLCLCECPRPAPEAAEAETVQHRRPCLLVPSCMLGSALRRACTQPCLVRGVPDCKLALWFVQGMRPAGRSRASPRATSARPAWAHCWARWAWRAATTATAPATAGAAHGGGGSRQMWTCRKPTCAASARTGMPSALALAACGRCRGGALPAAGAGCTSARPHGCARVRGGVVASGV